MSIFAGCIGGEDVVKEDPLNATMVTQDASDGAVDGKVISVSAIGGAGSYTYSWKIDGDSLNESSNRLELGDLIPMTHTVSVTVTDSDGKTIEKSVIFTSLEPNYSPEVQISLVGVAYSGTEVQYSSSATDANGDTITYLIDFGDGSTSTEATGIHVWNDEGGYNVTVTVTDLYGATGSDSATILIATNLPPSLDVAVEPVTDGNLLVMVDEQVNLTLTVSDPEGGAVTQTVDWGDTTSTVVTTDSATHAYPEAGTYNITVTVTDSQLSQTSQIISVEVLEDLTNSNFYEYYEENLPDENEVESEIDSDGDGTVDDAEQAENEGGYDWQSDFDPDGDGEADHDEGNIDSWQLRDENGVSQVAQSNDTAGGGRSSRTTHDPLVTPEDHLSENETDTELPDENLSGQGEIMDDLFDDTGDEMDSADDDPALTAEHYEDALNGTHAVWWNESFMDDLDEDGTNESTCQRATAVMWRDGDGDGNPERTILYRVRFCTADRDSDGTPDVSVYEVEALNATDMNDNGTPEILEALHLVVVTWTNGTMVDTNTYLVAAAAVDLDEDGNLERAMVAGAVIRQVDIDGDGVHEGTHLVYGIIAAADSNDDGTPENAIMLVVTTISLDLDGDGNVNHSATWGQIVHTRDRNWDGQVDQFRAAQFGEEKYDNNSDGTVDSKSAMWIGVGITDRNFDGTEDKVVMAMGAEHEDDADGDGLSETKQSYFFASTVKDLNADGHPEHIWYLTHSSEGRDIDDDGDWDFMNETAAGAEARDWNSDGNIDYYGAIRIYAQKQGQQANGWNSETTATWILQMWDVNSNGNVNVIHAVAIIQVHWDNNSDGTWNTEWTNANVWHGIDFNGDGHYERAIFVGMTSARSDDNADGNIEWQSSDMTIHTRNSTITGHVNHEYYFHLVETKANISTQGVAQYENTTLLAYETWDTPARQETHAVVIVADSFDWDRDGVKDVETVHLYHDNRQNQP